MSAPLDVDFRYQGGAAPTDSWASGIEHSEFGYGTESYTPTERPIGTPGFHDFMAAPDGSRCCRFSVTPAAADATIGTRAEFRTYPPLTVPDWPGSLWSFYRIKLWLGSEWLTKKPASIAQMHRGADSVPSTAWLHWLVWVRDGAMELSIPSYSTNASDYTTVSRAPLVTGRWMDLGVEMRFAKGAGGSARLWVDGRGYDRQSGIRTAHDTAPNGPMPKVGIYNILAHTDQTYMMYAKQWELHTQQATDAELGVARRNRRQVLPGRR